MLVFAFNHCDVAPIKPQVQSNKCRSCQASGNPHPKSNFCAKHKIGRRTALRWDFEHDFEKVSQILRTRSWTSSGVRCGTTIMTTHDIAVKMLFTHSAVQKNFSQISDLRCWKFQSGLWEKGSEVVFLNEHVFTCHICLCQTCVYLSDVAVKPAVRSRN